jgi:4-hydroxyproline epimerase
MDSFEFRVIDSHTGGEPTRTIVEGGPDLSHDPNTGNPLVTIAEKVQCMRANFDGYRRAIVNEPRGSEVMVGALLVQAERADSGAGVIFFNNVGYLGMCGHGTIGVVETLRYLGKLAPGACKLDTCVGAVTATLHPDKRIAVENVASYRDAIRVPIELPGLPVLYGDIAYGGNWFCLVDCPDPSWLERPPSELIQLTSAILSEVRGSYPLVDHVELFGPPRDPSNHSRSFVLCPGGAYDRSPCGTGTSAKLACLAADGKLTPGETWRQESIIGSVFEGSYHWIEERSGHIAPRITSRAFINADCRIVIDSEDPFAWGLPQ